MRLQRQSFFSTRSCPILHIAIFMTFPIPIINYLPLVYLKIAAYIIRFCSVLYAFAPMHFFTIISYANLFDAARNYYQWPRCHKIF